MKTRSKGFTLIELLVVIAIIGILAALVLVALGNARNKANDARIKSNVGQMRTIAEIIYDSNGAEYINTESGATESVETCFNAPDNTVCNDATGGIASNVATLRTDVGTANGALAGINAEALADAFCVSAQLNDTNYVCVDNTGVTVTTADNQCDNTNADCASP